MKVICIKISDNCFEGCEHSIEHEPDIHDNYGSCTKWGPCYPDPNDQDTFIKARCTKVKGK